MAGGDGSGDGGDSRVHPDCINAFNPYHELAQNYFQKIAEARERAASLLNPPPPPPPPPAERTLHQDCIDASDPYHECDESCFKRIAQAKYEMAEQGRGFSFVLLLIHFHLKFLACFLILAEPEVSIVGATNMVNSESEEIIPMGVDTFPPHGIAWPSGIQITPTASTSTFKSHFLSGLEELFQQDPPLSLEEMRILLNQSTKGWHIFGFPQDIWMAKVDSLWKEFGCQHMRAARRRQCEEELQKVKTKILSLLTRAEVARTRAHDLRQELANIDKELVDLEQQILQENTHATDLRKSLAGH